MRETQLANQLTIAEIVEKRDQALSMFEHGYKAIEKAFATTREIMERGVFVRGWYNVKVESFKKDLDRSVWRHLFQISGASDLMNADQKNAFEKSMEHEVPEVTVEFVRATLLLAQSEKDKTFIEGLIGTLQGIDRSYKSNKAFKINKKLVFSGVAGWGAWASTTTDRMVDLERMIHIVNNEKPPEVSLRHSVNNIKSTQAVKEFKYFTVKTFKNGNAHLIINCKGTLNKINNLIAEYFDSNGLANEHN